MKDLFYGTSGPRNARIAFVAESWGRDEKTYKTPLVGYTGQNFNAFLEDALRPLFDKRGYTIPGDKKDSVRARVFCTNVVSEQPPDNDMWHFFFPRDEAPKDSGLWGLHPKEETREEINRMYDQLDAVNPDLVVAMGNYSMWALTTSGRTEYSSDAGGRIAPVGITSYRGSMVYTRPREGKPSYKCLLAIHPAAWCRQWEERTPSLFDLQNRVPQALDDDWFDANPTRIVHRPTFAEVEEYFTLLLERLRCGVHVECALDCETMLPRPRIITCLSFCYESHSAITVPFIDRKDGKLCSYWTSTQEITIIRLVTECFRHENFYGIGQNFLYDQSFFLDHWGISPRCIFDTMLGHHLLFPGTPKDLGYLSSLYCRYHRYWKDDNRDWDIRGSLDDHFKYNAEDTIRTLEVAGELKRAIRQLGRWDHWVEELEKQEWALEIMEEGIAVDLDERARQKGELLRALEQRQRMLFGIVPQRIIAPEADSAWIDSPKQQQDVFYKLLMLPVQKNRNTGRPSLDAKAIEALKTRFPEYSLLFDLLDEYRSIQIYHRNFISKPLDFDRRWRCTVKTAGPETFRWATSEHPRGVGSNMQNIPGEDQR